MLTPFRFTLYRVKQSAAWSLVLIQLGLLAVVFFAPHGALWARTSVVWTLAIVLVFGAIALGIASGIQLGTNLTPNPIPKQNGELVTSGVYHYVRHPIYTALMMGAAGATVLGASIVHLTAMLCLFILLGVKARVEERMLEARFDSYHRYAGQTGRFFPGIGRMSGRPSGES